MNLEQLKLIVDMLSSAGEGAFTFGCLYLLKDFAGTFLFAIVVLVMILLAVKLIQRGMDGNLFFEELSHIFGYELRNKVQVKRAILDVKDWKKAYGEKKEEEESNEG